MVSSAVVLSAALFACSTAADRDGDDAVAVARLAATSATPDGRTIYFGECATPADCAAEVPRTGRVSPLFSELDNAVAMFMKLHCVGALTLSVTRSGEIVYKRGFGKMDGAPASWGTRLCNGGPWNSDAEYVLPDTPMLVGSVSKYVTSAMVRELVWIRIVERGMGGVYADPSEARLLDPDLELLPPSLLRYFDQTRDDAACPPVAVEDDDFTCARAGPCGDAGPDDRWQDVTVGDLLAHSAGLPRSAPDWGVDVMPNVAALRGYTSLNGWTTDDSILAADTPYYDEMVYAREYLGIAIDVDHHDIYFLNHYDPLSLDPLDEILTMVAGRCLESDPASQTDGNPAPDTGYTNTGAAILDRVVTHLSPTGRFAAPDGHPELHEGSAGCGACGGTGAKGGDAAGIRSRLFQLAGSTASAALPVDGGFVVYNRNVVSWPTVSWTDPAGVDFVVTINQDNDEYDLGTTTRVDEIVRYGLSRVDWDAVDRLQATRWRRVAGIAMDSAGDTHYWYEDGTRRVRPGATIDHHGVFAADSVSSYALPSVRTPATIVGMAIGSGNQVYAWYDDGRVSTGEPDDLSADSEPVPYSLPPKQTCEDIVAIAISQTGRVYSWYHNGQRAIGTPTELDAHGVGNYSLPPGQTADDVVGVAIDWADDDKTYSYYRDGSAARGWTGNLDANAYLRGVVAGMSAGSGDTTVWYTSGFRRTYQGNLGDNIASQTVLDAGFWQIPEGADYHDVVGVGMLDGLGMMWIGADGVTSIGKDLVVADDLTTGVIDYPAGATAGDLVGIDFADNGTAYSWYRNGVRARGITWDLDSVSSALGYGLPPGQTYDTIAAIAIDSETGDGAVWTLYVDGSVSRGRSWDLDYYQYWPAE